MYRERARILICYRIRKTDMMEERKNGVCVSCVRVCVKLFESRAASVK